MRNPSQFSAFVSRAARLILTGTILASMPSAQASPPLDPLCGSGNSLKLVQEARLQKLAEGGRMARMQLQPTGPPLRLSIERSGNLDLPRVILEGARGQTCYLESLSDFNSRRWIPWLSVTLPGNSLEWSDETMRTAPYQFFRLRTDGSNALFEPASNFRLLDAQGIARDLYYHTELEGIAVLAAGTNLEEVNPLLPLLNELAASYTNRIQIWLLLSDPAPVRTNILAQIKNFKINFPVLLDPHGLAAHSTGLTRQGEVALIRSPDFTITYRGAVTHPNQSTASQSFLGQALSLVNSQLPLTYLRTPTDGPRLASLSDEVPDYARDIAPTLRQYCAVCHRPNSVAPFALTNFSVVEANAPAIKHALLSGKMPPWHADPEYSRFANDISLPGNLKSAVVRWIDSGMPRQSAADPLADLPLPPAFDQWPTDLGQPDALVTIPLQSIKESGSEPYRYIFVQAPNPTNVWLRAAVIRPSNYRAVHHYLVWPGRIGNSGTPDNSTYQSHIAEFVPGYKPFRFPDDAYVALSRSNWLTFNLHYNTYGEATNDQPVLALWYHKTKPPRQWITGMIGDASFRIPPGASNYPVRAEWTTPNQITLRRLNPHMHVRGKTMKYEVFYPGGKHDVVLSVPDYDFSWQVGYELAEPLALPKNTRIVVSGSFDNSPQNLSNPDPTAEVRWGDQSWMEMFVGFIDYTQ